MPRLPRNQNISKETRMCTWKLNINFFTFKLFTKPNQVHIWLPFNINIYWFQNKVQFTRLSFEISVDLFFNDQWKQKYANYTDKRKMNQQDAYNCQLLSEECIDLSGINSHWLGVCLAKARHSSRLLIKL